MGHIRLDWERSSLATDLIYHQSHRLLVLGSLRVSKGEGYLRHLWEPRGILGNTGEYWGVLAYLSPWGPPP